MTCHFKILAKQEKSACLSLDRKVNKTSQEDMRLHFNESLDFWVTFMSINNYVPTHIYVRLMVKHLARVKPSVFTEENLIFLLKVLTYSSIIF